MRALRVCQPAPPSLSSADAAALAAEAGQQLDVLDREVELLVAVVDQAQAVMRGGADLQGFEPVVAADAVFLVHDEVALGDLGGFGDELVGALAAAGRAADALAEQVLLADQRRARSATKPRSRPSVTTAMVRRRQLAAVGPGVGLLDRDAVLAQQVGEALARAAGPGGDDGAAASARPGRRPGP